MAPACHDQMVDAWIWWVVIGAALVVAELFTGTFVLVMLGAGAFAAAIAAGLGAGYGIQAVVFALVSALALVGVRPSLSRRLHRNAEHAPMGLDAIEGAEGLVLEQVDADRGLVKIGGEMWRARSYDATQVFEPGVRVRVIEVKGAIALVWRE
jgi:membrane protein implicated in regulation of membrane protease activity